MLIQADARAIPLRDGCVQCVITSPPYFGLRDYGTGRWDGGNPECDHIAKRLDMMSGWTQNSAREGRTPPPDIQYRGECGKCGANRIDSQIGLEPTPDAYVSALVGVFREVRRVLADDGVCWLNLGDSYAGSGKGAWDRTDVQKEVYVPKPGGMEASMPKTWAGIKAKDLLGIPWRVAFALQADGWYLRSDVIWSKPNPMPESVTDRPTKAHEYLFLLAKSQTYYYNADAIRERAIDPDLRLPQSHMRNRRTLSNSEYDKPYTGKATKDYEIAGAQDPSAVKSRIVDRILSGELVGRNRRSVWEITTQPYSGAHFATMPEKLVEPCILAGSRPGDLVFDPFIGSGTVGAVAERLGRRWCGTDLNPAYHQLAKRRTAQRGLMFPAVNE